MKITKRTILKNQSKEIKEISQDMIKEKIEKTKEIMNIEIE